MRLTPPVIEGIDDLVIMGLLAYGAARWISPSNHKGNRFGDFSELVADITKSMNSGWRY